LIPGRLRNFGRFDNELMEIVKKMFLLKKQLDNFCIFGII